MKKVAVGLMTVASVAGCASFDPFGGNESQSGQKIMAGAGYTTYDVDLGGCKNGTDVNCNSYLGKDYAFIVLNRASLGRNAGDITGAYSFYMNAPTGNVGVIHMGYPAEGNWNPCTSLSCKPWQCTSPIQKYDQYAYANKWDVGFSCYTTGGASGGPNFQNIGGRYYVTSVLSHMGVVHCQNGTDPCPVGSPRYGLSFYGSYLDNDALSIFNFAKTL